MTGAPEGPVGQISALTAAPSISPYLIMPARDAEAYTATIIDREDVTETLMRLWVRPDQLVPYEVGQYLTLGLVLNDQLVQRPYSVVSTPDESVGSGLEFYVRRIDGGRLTQALWHAPMGQRIRAVNAKGRLALREDDDRPLLLVASGTGVAPFVAMTRHLRSRRSSRRVVLVHGVSFEGDLGYRSELEALEREADWLSYLPTVSRPTDAANTGWQGRVGRVEAAVPHAWAELNAREHAIVARVCGVSDMARSVEAALIALGCDQSELVKEFAALPPRPARSSPPAGDRESAL